MKIKSLIDTLLPWALAAELGCEVVAAVPSKSPRNPTRGDVWVEWQDYTVSSPYNDLQKYKDPRVISEKIGGITYIGNREKVYPISDAEVSIVGTRGQERNEILHGNLFAATNLGGNSKVIVASTDANKERTSFETSFGIYEYSVPDTDTETQSIRGLSTLAESDSVYLHIEDFVYPTLRGPPVDRFSTPVNRPFSINVKAITLPVTLVEGKGFAYGDTNAQKRHSTTSMPAHYLTSEGTFQPYKTFISNGMCFLSPNASSDWAGRDFSGELLEVGDTLITTLDQVQGESLGRYYIDPAYHIPPNNHLRINVTNWFKGALKDSTYPAIVMSITDLEDNLQPPSKDNVGIYLPSTEGTKNNTLGQPPYFSYR